MVSDERSPWLGVEPRLLATLAAVVETGSFRVAARQLGSAQSTVSSHVAALEQAVGLVLVERRSGMRPARPTPAGRRLAAAGVELLDRLSAARADVRAAAADEGRRLRVAVDAETHPALLVPVVAAIRGRDPRVTLHVDAGARAACLAAVRAGEADVAVVGAGADAGGVALAPFGPLFLAWNAFRLPDPLVTAARERARLPRVPEAA